MTLKLIGRYKLLIANRSHLVRFLIRRQWMAEFRPDQLKSCQGQLHRILGLSKPAIAVQRKKFKALRKTWRKKRQAKLIVIRKEASQA